MKLPWSFDDGRRRRRRRTKVTAKTKPLHGNGNDFMYAKLFKMLRQPCSFNVCLFVFQQYRKIKLLCFSRRCRCRRRWCFCRVFSRSIRSFFSICSIIQLLFAHIYIVSCQFCSLSLFSLSLSREYRKTSTLFEATWFIFFFFFYSHLMRTVLLSSYVSIFFLQDATLTICAFQFLFTRCLYNSDWCFWWENIIREMRKTLCSPQRWRMNLEYEINSDEEWTTCKIERE